MSVVHAIGYQFASVLKWLSGLLFAILCGAVLALAVYDLVEFEPRRDEIQALLAQASPAERAPPPLLFELERADAGDATTWQATRLILMELDRNVPRMRTLARMRRELLWTQLVKIHLSEDDQLLIHRSRVFMGQRTYGLDAGAHSIFGRPLDRLSDQELAELVVIARWPTRYRTAERAEYVARAARALIERVGKAR